MTPIWYGYAKRIALAYVDDANSDNPDAQRRAAAVMAAVRETERLPDGKARMDAINMVLIRKTHTAAGAGLQIPASERTVQKWTRAFILEIGKALQLP
ncbi:hypothetical protein [Butyricicoccus sp.]|uniref:hypothetical protein n=1 Tax=Butyricicoccus sp. TaxID=2049021 RepID=UPI003F157F1C